MRGSLNRDCDRTVGFSDLVILAQNYGQPGTPQQGDIDLDGTVGFSDLLLLAQTHGSSGPAGAVAARSLNRPRLAECGIAPSNGGMAIIRAAARRRPDWSWDRRGR